MVPRVSATNVGKQFPGVRALANVDFEVRSGEVHALCGENGAGKSTLMKIIAGEAHADSGELALDGETFSPASPAAARDRGVLLVHQELALVPELSVAENLYLGRLPRTRWGNIDRKCLHREAGEVFAALGYAIDPAAPLGNLSIAARQTVEIARAWAFGSRVVIFDEPTASLSEAETDLLFANIARLKRNGTGIVYITHKMREIFQIADRISVLRDGEIRATLDTGATSESEITRLMFGRELAPAEQRVRLVGEELLRIEGIRVPGFIENASLTIHEGEILGLYGLIGSGRSEMIEGMLGLRTRIAGRIFWRGTEAAFRTPADAFRLGIGYVPEDRRHQGLALRLNAGANMALVSRASQIVDRKAEARLFETMRDRLAIRVTGPQVEAGTLSGGNQQKIVLGKWLATNPQMLILDEPTRGIDVNAKAEIYALIRELADAGMAVLLISSEIAEILRLTDRTLTFRSGSITGALQGTSLAEEALAAGVAH